MPANWTTTRKTNVAIAVALALSGCARSPFPVIESKIDGMKGQPIKTVIDKLGEPDEQNQIGGEKAYVWLLPNKSGFAYQAVGFECTIKVFVDKDDKITHYGYNGNVGGCGQYAHKLDDAYHTAQGILDF